MEVELFDTVLGGYPTSFYWLKNMLGIYLCSLLCNFFLWWFFGWPMLPRKFGVSTKRGCWRTLQGCLHYLCSYCWMCAPRVTDSGSSCCSSVLVWGSEPDEGVFLLLRFSDMVWENERNKMACSEYPDEEWIVKLFVALIIWHTKGGENYCLM